MEQQKGNNATAPVTAPGTAESRASPATVAPGGAADLMSIFAPQRHKKPRKKPDPAADNMPVSPYDTPPDAATDVADGGGVCHKNGNSGRPESQDLKPKKRSDIIHRKKDNVKHSTGRPSCQIDRERFEKYAWAGCEGKEIASALGVSYTTLSDWCKREYGRTFTEVAQDFRANGDADIKVAQMKQALAGDRTMLIWLGKNRLNQADEPQKWAKDELVEKRLSATLDIIRAAVVTVEEDTTIVKQPIEIAETTENPSDEATDAKNMPKIEGGTDGGEN